MFPGKSTEALQIEPVKDQKLIAWNGIQLLIPADWDGRVAGLRHLVFEKDFQLQLQIRWEKSVKYAPGSLQERAMRLADRMGSVIHSDEIPPELRRLKGLFGITTFFRGESGLLEGGVFLGNDHRTLVLFQLLFPTPTLLIEAGNCLATFSCGDDTKTLWRIQDLSLTIPVPYVLHDYTFGAGLTSLSFHSPELLLQTCKLGPADSRLGIQSLKEILLTLIDSTGLESVTGEDNTSCEAHRAPSIAGQLYFRLRRERPFIRARIWHDTVNNRLLAVVLSSNRPIPPTTLSTICGQYEII